MFNSENPQFRRRNPKRPDNPQESDFSSNQPTVSLLPEFYQPSFSPSAASFGRTESDSALVKKFSTANRSSPQTTSNSWRQERETLAQSILAAEFDEMPCRDRSGEFQSCCKSQQMKVVGNGLNGFPPAKSSNKLVADTIQFNQHAKKIGQDLSRTCAKLEQLSTLAKKKSLFDDRGPEISRLTISIKEDISLLNKQIAQLQEFAHSRMDSNSAKHHAQTHSRTVVVSLQSKLASVSNDFKQVLEVRTENLKQQKTRRDKFSQAQPVPSSLPPSASTGLCSVLLTDEAKHNNGDVSIPMDSVSSDNRYSQQLQLIEEQDSYIESRANAMANIESTIVELGTIFQQLAHMVQEQGEMVSRIDSNVEHTSLNIEAAHMELLKYFRGISQNRWLAIKVFGVLIVFFVIFIVFMT